VSYKLLQKHFKCKSQNQFKHFKSYYFKSFIKS